MAIKYEDLNLQENIGIPYYSRPIYDPSITGDTIDIHYNMENCLKNLSDFKDNEFNNQSELPDDKFLLLNTIGVATYGSMLIDATKEDLENGSGNPKTAISMAQEVMSASDVARSIFNDSIAHLGDKSLINNSPKSDVVTNELNGVNDKASNYIEDMTPSFKEMLTQQNRNINSTEIAENVADSPALGREASGYLKNMLTLAGNISDISKNPEEIKEPKDEINRNVVNYLDSANRFDRIVNDHLLKNVHPKVMYEVLEEAQLSALMISNELSEPVYYEEDKLKEIRPSTHTMDALENARYKISDTINAATDIRRNYVEQDQSLAVEPKANTESVLASNVSGGLKATFSDDNNPFHHPDLSTPTAHYLQKGESALKAFSDAKEPEVLAQKVLEYTQYAEMATEQLLNDAAIDIETYDTVLNKMTVQQDLMVTSTNDLISLSPSNHEHLKGVVEPLNGVSDLINKISPTNNEPVVEISNNDNDALSLD